MTPPNGGREANPPGRRYRAKIRYNGKERSFGYFDTEAERDAAVEAAWKDILGTCSECGLLPARPGATNRCHCGQRVIGDRLRRAETEQGDRGARFDGMTDGEWNRQRGYDPVTRTYTDKDPVPGARFDLEDWTGDYTDGLIETWDGRLVDSIGVHEVQW